MSKIIIVGGGTAGHVYPAISMASFFIKKNKNNDILFFTSKSGIENELLKKENFAFKSFKVYGISRKMSFKNIILNIKNLFYVIKSFIKIYSSINKFDPDFIISTGGYVSFNVLCTAIIKKIPFYLLESNAYPGLVTKIFAKYANKVFVNFDLCIKKLYNKSNIVNVGIPLRNNFIINKNNNSLLLKYKLPVILSFFGSLGSSNMNVKILDYLKQVDNNQKFIHIHITGNKEFDLYKDFFYKNNIIIKKYIHNIYDYINIASLIICRAGSTTLSEIAYFNKTAIIIPSPYVAENHQMINALEYLKKQQAIIMNEHELNGKILYNTVLNFIENKNEIKPKVNINQKKDIENIALNIYQIISQEQDFFCYEK